MALLKLTIGLEGAALRERETAPLPVKEAVVPAPENSNCPSEWTYWPPLERFIVAPALSVNEAVPVLAKETESKFSVVPNELLNEPFTVKVWTPDKPWKVLEALETEMRATAVAADRVAVWDVPALKVAVPVVGTVAGFQLPAVFQSPLATLKVCPNAGVANAVAKHTPGMTNRANRRLEAEKVVIEVLYEVKPWAVAVVSLRIAVLPSSAHFRKPLP